MNEIIKDCRIPKPEIQQEFIDFLYTYDYFIIAGHKEPDGDCIGSSIALSLFLNRIGKKNILMSAGPFTRTEIKKYENLFSNKLPEKKPDVNTAGLIIVDCSGFERVGEIADQLRPYNYAIIDHHLTNTEKRSNSIVMPQAPSTTYIIQSIIETITGKVTKDEADALFFGLCTDTGFFRHLEENSSEVFAHASRLILSGASPKKNFLQINGGKTFNSRILIGRILTRLQRYYGGKLIISYETYDDVKEFGLGIRDSDALYQLIQSIDGVEAICLIRQETPTHCSVGFRSLDKIDVSKIASSFGGGGHKQASGLYIEGVIENLIPQFLDAFKEQFSGLH